MTDDGEAAEGTTERQAPHSAADSGGVTGRPADLRAMQDGHSDRESPVDRHVGMVPHAEAERVLRLFERAADAFDESPEQYPVYRDVLRTSANKKVQHALDEGEDYVLANVVGDTGDRVDASGWRAFIKLQQKVLRPAYLAYIYGLMGDGKTDLALLLAEMYRVGMTERGYDPALASNIESWKASETIQSFRELRKWMKRDDVSERGRKLFVFDEASSHASGYADDASDARDLGVLVNLMRKSQTSMIIIGHTGKDVHPDIVRKTTHVVHKESVKRSRFMEVQTHPEGKREYAETYRLEGLPPTTEAFDTNEASTWSWGDDKAERQAQAMIEHGMPIQSKDPERVTVSSVLDVAPKTVHRWKRGWSDGATA